MNQYPKISVVTVNYNGSQYLENTILSVLTQNYPNLEYIIIDGASTDNSVDIIRKYENDIFYWISEPDSGMYDALQKGFDKSSGDIMCWLNSDDEYFPHTLASVADIFTAFPEVQWLTGANTFIDSKNRIIKSSPARKITKYDFYHFDYCWIQQESTFWTRSIWKKISNEGGGGKHMFEICRRS